MRELRGEGEGGGGGGRDDAVVRGEVGGGEVEVCAEGC